MSARTSTRRNSSTPTISSRTKADAEAYLARLAQFPAQLDGELGRLRSARAARPRPAGPPRRQDDQPARPSRPRARTQGGSLVELLGQARQGERHSPAIGMPAPARSSPAQVAPALDRQIAELKAERAVATDVRRHLVAADGRGILSLGAQGLDHHHPVARRGPRDGPRAARRAAGPNGPDPQERSATPRARSASACRRWPRTRATNSAKATRAAPRSWPTSSSGCRSSAPSCRALSTRSCRAISK